ncbi:MAG: hypothetical protein RLN96_08155 [Pseudomonadales bacterium]
MVGTADPFLDLPVAINALYGDPFIERQFPDTLERLKKLVSSGHRGPIGLYSHVPPNDKILSSLSNLTNLIDLHVMLSVTGLEEGGYSVEEAFQGYLAACSRLPSVILYIRPLVPGKNDSLNQIEEFCEIAASGHGIIATRPFYHPKTKKELDIAQQLKQFHRIAEVKGAQVFNRSACAISYVRGRPCSFHQTGKAKNIDLLKSFGISVTEHDSSISVDIETGHMLSKGDVNFLRFVSGTAVEARCSVYENTLCTLFAEGDFRLDCTSTWFNWGRQIYCDVDCYYCVARGHKTHSHFFELGCLPSELNQRRLSL